MSLELRATDRVEKSEGIERRTNTLFVLVFFMGFVYKTKSYPFNDFCWLLPVVFPTSFSLSSGFSSLGLLTNQLQLHSYDEIQKYQKHTTKKLCFQIHFVN